MATMTKALLTAAILACISNHADGQTRCTNPTKSKNTGGSCDFSFTYCGWDNSRDAGDDDDDDDVEWKRLNLFHLGQNSYMRVKLSAASAGSVAHLNSPLLCPTGSDAFRSLTFRYSIEKSHRCRLSVLLVTPGGRKRMWETTEGTGPPFSDPVGPLYLQCSSEPFQIVFEGKKLTGEPCGDRYDEIAIDDVIYSNVFAASAPHHECLISPSTTAPPVPHTDDTVTRTMEGGGGHASTEVVVSVVIVVIVVLVTSLALAYLAWRRKNRDKESRLKDLQMGSKAIDNGAYMSDSILPITARSTSSDGADNDVTDGAYDVAADVPRATDSAIYTEPEERRTDPGMPSPYGNRTLPPPPPPAHSVDRKRKEESDVTDDVDDVTYAIYCVPNEMGSDVTPPSPQRLHNDASPMFSAASGPYMETFPPISRDSSTNSRYNKLHHHRRHLGPEVSSGGVNLYDHLERGGGGQDEGQLYSELEMGDNPTTENGEEDGVLMEGSKPRSASKLESEYKDTAQAQALAPGTPV